MPQQLPLIPTVPNYRVVSTLGGTNVLLDVRWNARDAAWYLSISTEDDVLIVANQKLVLGALIGGRATSALFPRGYLIVSDLTGAGIDAGLDELGERIRVMFYGTADLA